MTKHSVFSHISYDAKCYSHRAMYLLSACKTKQKSYVFSLQSFLALSLSISVTLVELCFAVLIEDLLLLLFRCDVYKHIISMFNVVCIKRCECVYVCVSGCLCVHDVRFYIVCLRLGHLLFVYLSICNNQSNSIQAPNCATKFKKLVAFMSIHSLLSFFLLCWFFFFVRYFRCRAPDWVNEFIDKMNKIRVDIIWVPWTVVHR